MKSYSVEFKLYQYNSGAADNGTCTRSIDCETLEEAQSIKDKIDWVYKYGDSDLNRHDDVIWVSELISELTICGGFLKSTAEIYLTAKIKI